MNTFIVHCLSFPSGRQYYEQALRVRQLITDDFQKVFSTSSLSSTCSPSVDVILTPVSLGPAPLRSEMEKLGPVESSVYDTFSAPVNLSGKCLLACIDYTFIPHLYRFTCC